MRTLLSAISFLTIIPVRAETAPPGRSAALFPLVGAILGAAGAFIYLEAAKVIPGSLAALLTVAFWTLISGTMHEDGLADIADALRAGRTQEKMLAILKDSRIGTFGAVAIVLSFLARWQAVEQIADPRLIQMFIAAQAVPRAVMVALSAGPKVTPMDLMLAVMRDPHVALDRWRSRRCLAYIAATCSAVFCWGSIFACRKSFRGCAPRVASTPLL